MSVDSAIQKLSAAEGKVRRDLEPSRGLKPALALPDGRPVLSVLLALALIASRIARAFGEEDQLGYRHEYYREDGDRITVNTDSVLFDVGLNSHVRLVGTFVNDAISGATPTGAPPQSQWPYATFNSLYKTAYNQAYSSVYDQFVANNQIFVDQGYETYQQMTNQAGIVAKSAAPGIATNSASATYQGITNNPNYHNNSVPLTHMHDHRQAFSIGVPFSWGVQELTPLFSYSEESDYISYGGALTYSLALNQKNTTLTLGYSHNSDSVRDENFIWESKSSDDFLVGVSQLLNPKSYVTFDFTFGNENGYLADPYRSVMVVGNPGFLQANPGDAALFPEKRPRNRTKETAYLSYTRFIEPLNGSLESSYRFFHDSWDIYSHTFTLVWNQKLGKQIVLSPSFRYSLQSSAYFYYVLVPDYAGLPPYYSSDYRLTHFESVALGLNLTYRISRFLSLDASYLRYVMHGLDGVTSQSAYPSANVSSLGLRIWF
jgi:Protein of unknown function (DUF3570)